MPPDAAKSRPERGRGPLSRIDAKGERKRVRLARMSRAVEAAAAIPASLAAEAISLPRVDVIEKSPGAGAGSRKSWKPGTKRAAPSRLGCFAVIETSSLIEFLQAG